MSYRDDLDAAHARIEALEAELARMTEAHEAVLERMRALEADASFGRTARLQKANEVAKAAAFDEDRLREQMRREEAEVEAKIRAMREQRESAFRGDE